MDEVRGWRLHRRNLRSDDVTIRQGLRVTTVLRTVLDCAARLPLDQAVAIADSALRKRLMTIEELSGEVRRLPAGPGRRRLAQLVGLVDPKAGSVLESLARVLLWRHGLLPPETQWPVLDARRHRIGYVDFAWPQLRLVLETEGFEFHGSPTALRRDCRRHSALACAGWLLLRVTWDDVVHDPDYVVALVRETVEARAG